MPTPREVKVGTTKAYKSTTRRRRLRRSGVQKHSDAGDGSEKRQSRTDGGALGCCRCAPLCPVGTPGTFLCTTVNQSGALGRRRPSPLGTLPWHPASPRHAGPLTEPATSWRLLLPHAPFVPAPTPPAPPQEGGTGSISWAPTRAKKRPSPPTPSRHAPTGVAPRMRACAAHSISQQQLRPLPPRPFLSRSATSGGRAQQCHPPSPPRKGPKETNAVRPPPSLLLTSPWRESGDDPRGLWRTAQGTDEERPHSTCADSTVRRGICRGSLARLQLATSRASPPPYHSRTPETAGRSGKQCSSQRRLARHGGGAVSDQPVLDA